MRSHQALEMRVKRWMDLTGSEDFSEENEIKSKLRL